MLDALKYAILIECYSNFLMKLSFISRKRVTRKRRIVLKSFLVKKDKIIELKVEHPIREREGDLIFLDRQK